MAGSYTDVTERHELEAALQTAKVNLEQRVEERTRRVASGPTVGCMKANVGFVPPF